MTNRILFLMDLPKPVHGMSNINLAMLDSARKQKLNPKVINTVPSYAAKFFTTKWWGLFKFTHSLYCMFSLFLKLLVTKNKIVYRPINGGSGQIYDLVYLLLCRLFLKKIVIHHHSFNYLNNVSTLFSLLNKIAGNKATHITLGNSMRDKLIELYGININNITVLSNLAFFNSNDDCNVQVNNPIVIGHLANLCSEKGVDSFIDVCRALKAKELPFAAKIAGPFATLEAEKLVLSAVNEFSELEYLGPLYEKEKVAFYQSLDCFIFPSKYKNEAEPLVLYEAAMWGNLLLGTKRGCMLDVINKLNGFSFNENSELSENLASTIDQQLISHSFSASAKKERIKTFNLEYINALNTLTDIMDEFK